MGFARRVKLFFHFFLSPERMLLGSFGFMILLGTFLLKLPFATVKGHISTVDALFTATSAVCVTGLVVVDTGSYFTLAGQLIILGLIQAGGLGIMTFSVLFWSLLGREISQRGKMALEGSFSPSPVRDVLWIVKRVLMLTALFEAVGAGLLLLKWGNLFPLPRALYLSVFHAISAFCNAGFSPFSDSLAAFRGDWWTNLVVGGLIVLGGIGFIVLMDLKEKITSGGRLSLHTKVVLVTTGCLIFGGAFLLWITERGNVLEGMSVGEQILVSVFHSVTARTAGFSTVEVSKMGDAALFVLVILMFIGASPGSCGGGIKTTNLALLFSLGYNRFMGRSDAVMFKRTVPRETVARSISLLIGSFLFLTFVLLFFLVSEESGVPHKEGLFIEILFEITSAFGTVGLSAGMTSRLDALGKVLITVTMFVGRLGLLTMAYALAKREEVPLQYAEENIMVG
ncbi:MAG: hypothetical protein DRG33_05365 [Deltaproteobacteria bacterium]|nr:MAG: hypothetical protein DRG33_05365 [Deltaproteobacteria bacterium]